MEGLIQHISQIEFGDTAKAICSSLTSKSPQSLKQLADSTGLSSSDIRGILIILIKHCCISYKQIINENETEEYKYELIPENIIRRLRFPRYLCMDLKFNITDGKDLDFQSQIDILKEVMENGSVLGSNRLDLLVQNGYLVRTDFVSQIVKIQDEGEEEYKLIGAAKEESKVEASIWDKNSYYTINHAKFIHLMRSWELKKMAETKLDKQAGILIGLLLDDSKLIGRSSEFECTETVSFSSIFAKLKAIWESYEPNDKRVNEIKPLIESEKILKTHFEIMQLDSAEFIKKVKVDANTLEPYYSVQVHNLVLILQERWIEKI